uniref:Uncharacterized protein n=1 Tax=Globisporangium ultimum (strain ATCC 200006 / CBS 805.95 / DAOM BR144) TaxID=431595 RepID=K3W520_GLOUD
MNQLSAALTLGALNDQHRAKCAWHASIGLAARRSVLLHILLLLKTKYGKVDAKISYIARRAELALYSQAFSAWEYRNPHTLSRRLHSLVVKLHMNNLVAKEDEAFAVEDAQLCGASVVSGNERARQRDGMRHAGQQKRPGGVVMLSLATSSKRRRVDTAHSAQDSSSLFFDGNNDLVRQVCTFLDAKDTLCCSMTCTTANQILPGLVTSIRVSTTEFSVLTVRHRASFFSKFSNLEYFALTGDMAHAAQFDFHNETALISRNVMCRALVASLQHVALPKLTHFGLDFAFTEGLHDRVTSQVAAVLLAPSNSIRFPRLQKLSLRGNGISDDGVMHLFDALTTFPQGGGNSESTKVDEATSALKELNLEQNYIGERGFLQLEDTIELFAARGQAITIRMSGNLLAVAAND